MHRSDIGDEELVRLAVAMGLSETLVRSWLTHEPSPAFEHDESPEVANRVWSTIKPFIAQGQELLDSLPPRSRRTEAEEKAAGAILSRLRSSRLAFLRKHADGVYAMLTRSFAEAVRVGELVTSAAQQFPGLAPNQQQLLLEHSRPLKEKEGFEIDQGIFLWQILERPRSGAHLVYSMLRPLPDALELIGEFRVSGRVDLGVATLTRNGCAGLVELRNTEFLNAEDDATNLALETAIDLVILDPAIDVGVLRGAPVAHPKYAGRRIFNAGLNLTRLYSGQLPYMFYMTRDLGLVNKLYRGHSAPESQPDEGETGDEKPWIAAVESFAIGGGCQLLLVMDYVIAEHGAFFNLPARKEGIIPGAANLRLPRLVGERMARRAILFDEQFHADDPSGSLLCDEVVLGDEMDTAIERVVASLTGSGVVSAAGNRNAIRVGQEPLRLFQAYMATYAREQAMCHFSPGLVGNLEQYWLARQRTT